MARCAGKLWPLVLALWAGGGVAQVRTSTRPEFEVAVVKVSTGNPAEPRVQMTPGRVSVQNLSLRELIGIAYRVKESQISNGPSWINSERYDIDAKTDTGATGADPMLLMLQSLLEARFHLRFHHVAREQPVYLLVVAKSGVKMPAATCVPFDPNQLQKQAVLSDQQRRRQCGGIERRRGTLDGDGMSMEDGSGPPFQSLAGQLSLELDRPVINKTGLAGRFDVHLRWTDQSAAPSPDSGAAPTEANAPSIFTAVQEQLGLRLEPGKAPVDQFVIDQVERPGEN